MRYWEQLGLIHLCALDLNCISYQENSVNFVVKERLQNSRPGCPTVKSELSEQKPRHTTQLFQLKVNILKVNFSKGNNVMR